ncbi:rhamnan synthesis F family protein [Microbacterium sp. NE2HP2]|nr:rhamnan synthesis F family protein [Microbacterium plantarum]
MVGPAVFPVGGRRLLVYVVYDRRGEIDEYVLHAVRGMREHAVRILVVVNGALTEDGRARLMSVADEVLVRENVGFDIWAHKAALEHVGAGVAEFDEVVFTNDTWFGPVRPYGPVLDRMAERPVHFWGMTDHAREEPNPFTGEGVLPYHLQSFWIAVRREMLLSEQWQRYWAELPEMPSYFDAVLKHETIFTQHFADRGFTHDVAYPHDRYDSVNPSLFEADALIEDGCPTLKRRPFFHWPPFLDRHAVIGKWVFEKAADYGYPVDIALKNLARNVPPKVLNADVGLMNVVSHDVESYDRSAPLRTIVIAHIYYPEMTDEILDRADTLPGDYDLLVTTSDGERAAKIQAAIDNRSSARGGVEVRVVESNDGREQSAFLIGCRDVLLSGEYELVVKIHSKLTPQDGYNVGRHFREQQFYNLLDNPVHSANMVGLFQREPGLGLVYPPMIHVGYPTLGRAWWSNKPGFEHLAAEIGIRVPLDDVSPLAPYGSMYFARPEALRLLVEWPWHYTDFGGAEAYKDGGLAHILERMPSYAAGELGFHTRTAVTPEYLAVSHTSLDFKLNEMSATIPGFVFEKIDFLRHSGFVGTGSARDFLRMYMRKNHMPIVHRLRRVMDPSRRPGRWISRFKR